MATASTSKIRSGVERLSFANKDGKILPKKGEKNIIITSALPYVNNQPHLGNIIGSTMSADVYARYCRTRNWRTLFVCGTDEYGTASETAAMVEGITPQELCDRYHKKHAEVYEWFELAFDYFGRTSTPQHTEICQDIFTRLRDNGFLAENTMEQYYCEKDKKFLADRFVEGTCPKCGYEDARGDQCDKCSNPLDALDLIKARCKICGTEPIPRQTAHYFIKMDTLESEIGQYLEQAQKTGVWSKNAVQLTDGWLGGGLKQRCLTRDLSWGVPVPFPGWENKVLYVWFDAPIGYPSITANYTDQWKLWWHDPENVRLVQFMGKDNTPFHTLFFPSYLIGTRQKWTMLNSIGATEYLQYENAKFSKSRGVGVFGDNAKETGIPPSVWRYFLLANRPETSDSEFNWGAFIFACNSKLVDTFGNFVNRVAKFLDKNYHGVLPEAKWGDAEVKLAADVDALLDEYIDCMDRLTFRGGLNALMSIANRGNEYLQRQRLDNNLLANEPELCASVMLASINLIYLLTAVVHPFMPATEKQMLDILQAPPRALPEQPASGYAQNPGSGLTIDLLPGHKIGKPFHLFSKIDAAKEEVWRKQFGGKQATTTPATNGTAEGVAPPAGMSKKAAAKAAKAAKAPAYTGPRTPEMIELEKQVAERGARVRELKAAGQPFAEEVKALQEVKARLEQAVEAARNQITVSQE